MSTTVPLDSNVNAELIFKVLECGTMDRPQMTEVANIVYDLLWV